MAHRVPVHNTRVQCSMCRVSFSLSQLDSLSVDLSQPRTFVKGTRQEKILIELGRCWRIKSKITATLHICQRPSSVSDSHHVYYAVMLFVYWRIGVEHRFVARRRRCKCKVYDSGSSTYSDSNYFFLNVFSLLQLSASCLSFSLFLHFVCWLEISTACALSASTNCTHSASEYTKYVVYRDYTSSYGTCEPSLIVDAERFDAYELQLITYA